jgi:predicted RecB family nuclease
MHQELMHRATGGLQIDGRRLFRPSWVYQVLRDPFWVWCEYHVPRSEAVDETSRYDGLKRQRGIEYEQAWVRKHYPKAVTIEPTFGLEALRNTLQAMLQGRPAISQPQLWDLGAETSGRSDLLVRDTSHRSDLGAYHYRLIEIKQSRELQDYHTVQGALYNRMLAKIQGLTPPELTLVLRETVEQVPYAAVEGALDDVLATWRALRDGELVPEPDRPPTATSSPWRLYGNALVEQRKDLILLAGIQAREREKLRGAEIHSVGQLWNLGLKEVQAILGMKFGEQAYYTGQSYRTGRPILKPKCRLTIPRATRHLYFDVETSDKVHPTEPPHVYLIGCWDAERGQCVQFLARGAGDEGRIFREFLEYLGNVRNTKLYHWTDFEIGQLRDVSERWPALEGPLRRMASSCVDLKEAIKSAVYLPVPTFSLKCVAPALGFRWRGDGFGPFDSMVCYWDYLDGEPKEAVEKALHYNEDDCRAMWHIDQELSQRLA